MLRNLYVILTQGGVLQAVMPADHSVSIEPKGPPYILTLNHSFPFPPQDPGLLLAIFTAVVHDYEHKGCPPSFPL